MKPIDAKTNEEPERDRSDYKPFGLFIILFFSAVSLFNWVSPEKSVSTTADVAVDPSIERRKNAYDRAERMAIAGAQLIKKSMRDPDSFKLESVIITPSQTICYEYRSRNGFGGMSKGRVVISDDGGTIMPDETPGFIKLWNQECTNRDSQPEISSMINRIIS